MDSNWISVKNQLPQNAQRVLIAEYDPNYSSAAISGEYFTDVGFVYVDAREGMRRGRDVRYWMPSPEIPNEESDCDVMPAVRLTDAEPSEIEQRILQEEAEILNETDWK